MKQVDVIIPVYRPTKKLFLLLDRLKGQSLPPERIILINTEQSYFNVLIAGTDFWHRYRNVTVRHISKKEFDHGGTRRRAVKESDAPYFVMMTDDAVPADEYMLESLLLPLMEGKAAMSYARQLPAEGCGVIERYNRSFNYPKTSRIKTQKDLPDMGIKAFFASNVCAAYNRKVYDKLGGFVKHTIFNEDMIFARGLIEAGYAIAYEASAQVYHSHNYTGKQQFMRNFDLGVSHAQYPDIFEGVKTESEGIELVKRNCAYLIKVGKPWLIVKLIWLSGCRYMGYFLGKRYLNFSPGLRRRCSMNKEYWI